MLPNIKLSHEFANAMFMPIRDIPIPAANMSVAWPSTRRCAFVGASEKYDANQIKIKERVKRLKAIPPSALPKEILSKMAALPVTASSAIKAKKNHFIRSNPCVF